MKQKFLKYFKLLFGFILMNLFLFGFSKTKTGAKTTPRVPKLSNSDNWAPQLRARVNHGTPAAGVIGHVHISIIIFIVQ